MMRYTKLRGCDPLTGKRHVMTASALVAGALICLLPFVQSIPMAILVMTVALGFLATMQAAAWAMPGVHLNLVNDQVWWSALDDKDFTYTQRWGERTWTLTATKGRFTASMGDKEVFSCTHGVRVVTDLAGNVRQVVGIAAEPQSVVLQIAGARHELTVKPNQVWHLDGTKPVLLRSVRFDYPYQARTR
jgi:hypothetical protein